MIKLSINILLIIILTTFAHYGCSQHTRLQTDTSQSTAKDAPARPKVSTTRVRQMIIEKVTIGAEKFGRDIAIPKEEVLRLQNTARKLGRPVKK